MFFFYFLTKKGGKKNKNMLFVFYKNFGHIEIKFLTLFPSPKIHATDIFSMSLHPLNIKWLKNYNLYFTLTLAFICLFFFKNDLKGILRQLFF